MNVETIVMLEKIYDDAMRHTTCSEEKCKEVQREIARALHRFLLEAEDVSTSEYLLVLAGIIIGEWEY